MRFIIYGAGAIGGVLGARLYQRRTDVVLIARGEHRIAIQSSGLVLESPSETVTLPLTVVAHPSEITFEPEDVVVLAIKSQDTTQALAALREFAGDAIPIVCCQNGVANEREASRLFEHVYGMAVLMPAAHLEPGVVQTTTTGATGVLDCGLYPLGIDDTIREIAFTLEEATFVSRVDPAIMRMKYAKLLRNLGNALQAACGSPDGANELMRRVRAEALDCYAAAGIDCAGRDEFRARVAGRLDQAPIQGRPRSGGSSWQSLSRGTGSIEADHLNGEITLLGRLHGVPTPANRALQQIANELARAGAQPASLSIDAVRKRVERLAASSHP